MAVCSSCGVDNPERAKFCLACGTALAAAAVARKERKFATALFADLVGSTTLAEREDPEVVQSVVSRAFDRLAEEIERYGGLVEKFMGDAVLAVFGVPKAHEDDPERAVRCALEMQATLSELNRGFDQEGKPQIQMRVGVEAGEVLVDVERIKGARDRMLTGDAVNTAARLQAAAEPGHVVVGPAVYASTKDVIEYRGLPALELKGKAEPVPAWEALRVKARVRGERPPLGLEARLVGRDEEMTVLKQTLHRVASEERPALVTIVGPAGVGKSRLVQELLKYVEGLPAFIYWRAGRCLAYGNVSYSALTHAIKAQCEILEDDPAETVSAKVERTVVELFGDNAVSPHVEALVGSAPERAISREDLFDTWRRFLERMAARYPLVLALEDLQWADAGLLDFVDHLADWAQGPILVLATARAELLENRPTWGGGKRNATSIFLESLTPDEDAAMVDDLVPGPLSAEVKRLIVERSEGNPLFTEEIVRTLIDRGVLRATEASRWEVAAPVTDLELPRSIQGLIAARLDALPDDEKAVLQDAAVVGRVFWTGAIARLSDRPPGDVRGALGRLRVKEIVVPREPSSFSGEFELAFRHNLIRDGAYESLPKSSRAEKHVAAARWAEERAGDRADEIAEQIATHYVESLEYLRELGETSDARRDVERSACRWARAAGDRAARLWQQAEAVRWYRAALGLADPTGLAAQHLVELWSAYARACFATEPYEETERAYRSVLELSETLGDDARAGWAESQLAITAFQQGRDDEVLGWAERALARLEPLGDGEDLAGALHILGWYHWRRGHLEQAEPILRRSIDIASRVGALVVLGDATNTLGVTLINAGRTEEGVALSEESYRIAKEAGDLQLLLRMHINVSSVLIDYTSQWERALAIGQEGLELARRAGVRSSQAWILGNLGSVLADLGRLEEAESCEREAVELARAIAEAPLVGMCIGGLAFVRFLRGDVAEAERLHRESAHLAEENPEPQMLSYVHFTDGLLALAHGRDEEAIERFERGVDLARTAQVGGTAPLIIELVRTLLRVGRNDEAAAYRDLARTGIVSPAYAPATIALLDGLVAEDANESAAHLREAAEVLEAMKMTIHLARCLMDLAGVEERLGRDPRETLERARALLASSGSGYYLAEAEAALAALP